MEIVGKREFATQVRARLQNTTALPPLPELAHDLLRLRNNPHADIDDLASIIKRDPSLAAQVMRQAKMGIYGYGDRLTSIEQAISLVMGFENALFMTLGIASGKFLNTPNTGPLARQSIWQQALATAALAQQLSTLVDKKIRPSSGLCYLSGLLHNFGYFLFGHWYPEHYNYLNKLIEAHPEDDIRDLELHAFGITHDMVGTWLLRAWNMPPEVITAVSEHHFPDFGGENAIYPKLVAIANRMLGNPGMKDSCAYLDTDALLESIGIDHIKAEDALEKVKKCLPQFREVAGQM
ncbi:MAG: HDOD domain-containing protein [Pseudomonadota bacterium]